MSFDWIEHRKNCTALGKLKDLADILEKDVDKANALELSERGGSTYKVIRNLENSPSGVVLQELSDAVTYGEARPIGAIFFNLVSGTNHIQVVHATTDRQREELFRVVVIRELTTCKIRIQEPVDGEEADYGVELWQISEKTLGRLILTS